MKLSYYAALFVLIVLAILSRSASAADVESAVPGRPSGETVMRVALSLLREVKGAPGMLRGGSVNLGAQASLSPTMPRVEGTDERTYGVELRFRF